MSVKPFFFFFLVCSTQPVHHKIMLNWGNSPEKKSFEKTIKDKFQFFIYPPVL